MKKLIFLAAGCMLVSIISYSKNFSDKTNHLNLSPVKGYYLIGNTDFLNTKSLMMKSVPGGNNLYHALVKGYYGIGNNGTKLKKSIFLLPNGSKKIIVQKGFPRPFNWIWTNNFTN
ncbi:MAG: hypothetical protein H7Z13_07010 [Ferruginibacter sp.]|nr:hypothetical protein [Ferruginibacter sp.]